MSTEQQRKDTHPLILIRPDGAGVFAVDTYDDRKSWQASALGLTKEEVQRHVRRLRTYYTDHR